MAAPEDRQSLVGRCQAEPPPERTVGKAQAKELMGKAASQAASLTSFA